MISPSDERSQGAAPLQDVDVLIVGAGPSGIGAARRLRQRAPGSSYAIVEAGASMDGIPDSASESDAEEHIAYGTLVLRASWSGDPAHWLVTLQDCESGALATMSCSFLYLCSGHHRHAEDHTPAWPGLENFTGEVVPQQRWPENLDLTGKDVVIVGDATATTLAHALVPTAAHVTMLRRSHSFVLSRPAQALVRKWMVMVKRLPKGSGADRRRTRLPKLWDQSMDSVPNDDFFLDASHAGRPNIVTDRIESFTKTGLRLRSGQTLDADVIVTAANLDLHNAVAIELIVDGAPVEAPHYVLYPGTMLDGVPNLVFDLGASDASWTLTADLASDHVARLVALMEERGYVAVTPRLLSQPTEDSPAAGLVSSQFQRPGQAIRAPRRLRARRGRDSTFLRGLVAARELEFTPADA